MSSDWTRARGNRELRFFGVLRESPALHFYLMQFVAFAYVFYRFASRSYEVYGRFPHEMFDFPRRYVVELWPTPGLYFTTFQFIYEFVPRPTPEVIFCLQLVILGFCVLGMAGLLPRLSALVCFVLGIHITGMMQSSNGDVDGGSLVMLVMLIMVLSPKENFYGPGRGFSPERRSVDTHWPVFLVLLAVGGFYTLSGLNKIFDVGPHWPFVLHLERRAVVAIENAVVLTSHFTLPNSLMVFMAKSPIFGIVSGTIAFIAEVGAISLLVLPRYRFFVISGLAVLHVMVFTNSGINFVGSTAVLLLCFDWNVLVRRAEIYYDGDCGFCERSLLWVKRFDWFDRLTIRPSRELAPQGARLDPALLENEVGLQDENGELYYGADAFEQIATRCPVLMPFALLMKVPGAILVARHVYDHVAANRRELGSLLPSPGE